MCEHFLFYNVYWKKDVARSPGGVPEKRKGRVRRRAEPGWKAERLSWEQVPEVNLWPVRYGEPSTAIRC
jgi:hypothetical protein